MKCSEKDAPNYGGRGRSSVRDMVDQRGNPLTLEQLKGSKFNPRRAIATLTPGS